MSLTKTKGNGELSTALRQDLEEMFDIDNIFNDPFFRMKSVIRPNLFNRMPATNIREDKKEYIVEVAAPGMKKNDFQVDIDNGCLEIKVDREKEEKKEGKNYTRREYNYSSFYRSFNLPESVKSENVKAEYENGVLQIHLPKKEETQKKPVKKIQID